ncbi:hypothetical protein DPMN_020798 [Dreissena polymorpha]|uniref:Uncharacterized protein n=1 Tax=Dreissena polymorpha TaxID=45954 RepID=A0A9D4NLN4_DREPO|nr:hypothetical protein DPMN_020798 [Dreissena polymorpha]
MSFKNGQGIVNKINNITFVHLCLCCCGWWSGVGCGGDAVAVVTVAVVVVELQCCERDHAELLDTLWYKYDEESQSWEPLAPDTSDILFLERNATLAIKHAQFSDTGRYKFTRPSGKSIQSGKSGNEFDLKVVACDQLARGPFPLAPLPCGVTSLKVGDHVTIPRTGYFGCDQVDVIMVTWFMKANASDYSSWAEVPAADDIITKTDRHVIFSLILAKVDRTACVLVFGNMTACLLVLLDWTKRRQTGRLAKLIGNANWNHSQKDIGKPFRIRRYDDCDGHPSSSSDSI